MNDLRQAAEIALEAMDLHVETYPHFDKGYMVDARSELRQALAQRHECETCANKIKRLTEAGFLKSPLRKDHGFDRTASHMAGEYVNTAQQEPIALKVYQGEICYMSQDDDQSFGMWCPVNHNTDLGFPNETKFYTAPPKREWVGLTDEEVLSFVSYTPHPLTNKTSIVYAIEAKLKEKNT